jgi:hypothetical protein
MEPGQGGGGEAGRDPAGLFRQAAGASGTRWSLCPPRSRRATRRAAMCEGDPEEGRPGTLSGEHLRAGPAPALRTARAVRARGRAGAPPADHAGHGDGRASRASGSNTMPPRSGKAGGSTPSTSRWKRVSTRRRMSASAGFPWRCGGPAGSSPIRACTWYGWTREEAEACFRRELRPRAAEHQRTR